MSIQRYFNESVWFCVNEDGADGASVLIADGEVIKYESGIVDFCLCIFVCGGSSAGVAF